METRRARAKAPAAAEQLALGWRWANAPLSAAYEAPGGGSYPTAAAAAGQRTSCRTQQQHLPLLSPMHGCTLMAAPCSHDARAPGPHLRCMHLRCTAHSHSRRRRHAALVCANAADAMSCLRFCTTPTGRSPSPSNTPPPWGFTPSKDKRITGDVYWNTEVRYATSSAAPPLLQARVHQIY